MVKGNLATACVVLLSALLLSIYLGLQKKAGVVGGQIIDPNTWSLFIVVGLVFFSLILAIRYGRRMCRTATNEVNTESASIKRADRITMWVFIGLSAAYILSLKYIGYIFGTIAYLSITYRYLGVNEMKKIIILPLILVVIFVLAFGRMLYIPLPKGIGIFYEISSFLVG